MRIVVASGFCLVLLAGCTKPVDTAVRSLPSATSTITLASQVVETSCGECQFGMGGAGCTKPVDTAVRSLPSATSTITLASQVVETSCGECQFGMGGAGCDLAVRIDGKPYFVDGTHIDDHGDAHGDDGLCNCIRQARVSGEIRDGRFVATTFELLPTAADQ